MCVYDSITFTHWVFCRMTKTGNTTNLTVFNRIYNPFKHQLMKRRDFCYPCILILLLPLIISCSSLDNSETNNNRLLTGPYLGQKLPGSYPEIFAPGIVSIGPSTRDVAISPDGKEILFCMSAPPYSTILFTRWENDGWTDPEVVENLSDPFFYNFEPCFSPDGKRLFFLSNRPDTTKGETKPDQDIWAMDKMENGWGIPYNLGAPVNTDDEEYYPSVTNNGTLYFTRAKKGDPINYIYRSRLVDGKYSEPELLPENVNCGENRYNAYISRDEKFIIVPAVGIAGSFGGTDYYISFRNENDIWSEPVNMGPTVNTAGNREYSASLSPDGKYLFFMSQRALVIPEKLTHKVMKEAFFDIGNSNSAIYWVDASFIDSLKKE